MRKALSSKKHLLAWAVAGAGLAILPLAGKAATTNLVWDPLLNGSGSDGAGTWDTATPNWATGSGDIIWPNTGAYNATFGSGGAGGVVTIGSVTTGGITFANTTTSFYQLGTAVGSGTITLDGTFTPGGVPVIANNNTLASTATATNFILTHLAGVNGVEFSGAHPTFLGPVNNTSTSNTTSLNSGLFGGITLDAGAIVRSDSVNAFGIQGANVLTLGAGAVVAVAVDGTGTGVGSNTAMTDGNYVVSLGGLNSTSSTSIFSLGANKGGVTNGRGPLSISSQAGVIHAFAGTIQDPEFGFDYIDFLGTGTQAFTSTAHVQGTNGTGIQNYNLITGARTQRGYGVFGVPGQTTLKLDYSGGTAVKNGVILVGGGGSGVAFPSINLGSGILEIDGSTTATSFSYANNPFAVLPGASGLKLVNSPSNANTIFLSTNITGNAAPFGVYSGGTLLYTMPTGTQASTNTTGNGWISDASGNLLANNVFAGGAVIVTDPNNSNAYSFATATGTFTGTQTIVNTNTNQTPGKLVSALTTFDGTDLSASDGTKNIDQAAGTVAFATGTYAANTVRIDGASTINLGAGSTLAVTTGALLITPNGSGSIRGGTINAVNAAFAGGVNPSLNNTYATNGGQLIVHQYGSSNFVIGSVIADAAGTDLSAAPITTNNAATANGATGALTLASALAVAPGMTLTLGGKSVQVVGVSPGTDSTDTLIVFYYNNSGAALGANLSVTALTSHNGLVKSGTGDLTLSAANTYTGTTYVDQGVLRLANGTAIPGGITSSAPTTGSAIFLAGGVIGIGDTDGASSGDLTFSRAIGTGRNNVQWLGSGGFASFSASNATVNLGNAAADVGWGIGSSNDFSGGTSASSGFVPDGQALLLGAKNGQGTLIFKNGIGLQDGLRTISVARSTINAANGVVDATMAGVLKDAWSAHPVNGIGGIVKEGDGVLELNAANTYTGMTQISNGTLAIGHGGSFSSAMPEILFGSAAGTSGILQLGDTTSTGVAGAVGTASVTAGQIAIASGAGNANQIVGGSTGVSNLTINGTTNAIDTFSGAIGGAGTNQNNVAITMNGTGTFNFTGSGTYTGGTNVQNGTFLLGTGGSLAASNAVVLGNATTNTSGVLQLGDSGGAGGTTVTSLTTAGTGNMNAVVGGNASVSTLTINNAASNNYSGVLGGAGTNRNNLALTKVGGGALTLSGINTYTGATNVNEGTLTVNGSVASTTGGVIVGSLVGGRSPTLNGSGSIGGTVTLQGAAQDAGVLSSGTLAQGLASIGSLTLDGGSHLIFTSVSPATPAFTIANGLTLASAGSTGISGLNTLGDGTYELFGFGNITFTQGLFSDLGAAFSGTTQVGKSYTFFQADGSGSASGTGQFLDLTVGTSGGPIPAEAWFQGSQGSSWATLTGGSISNFDTTQTEGVNTGQLPGPITNVHFSASSVNTANLATTLDRALTINSLSFDGGSTAISIASGAGGLASTLTIAAGTQGSNTSPNGISMSAAQTAAVTILAPVILGNSQTWTNNSASSLTVSGAISGADTLTTAGSGMIILAGANSYSGTIVSSGTLQLSGSGTLGDINGDLAVNGTLDLNQTSQGAGNLTGAGTILNSGGSSASTLTIGNNNATGGIFSGVIEDNGGIGGTVALVKIGTGTATLTGDNTYSGGTTLSAGGLSGNTDGLQGSIAASAGTAITFINTTSGTFSGTITGGSNATVTINAPGEVVNFANANNYTGGTTLAGGTLEISDAGAVGTTGAITFSGGTLQYSAGYHGDNSNRFATTAQTIRIDTNGQNVTFANAILGSTAGSLVVSDTAGGGALTLTHLNSFTGVAEVASGGNLVLAGTTLNGSYTVQTLQIDVGGKATIGNSTQFQVNRFNNTLDNGTLDLNGNFEFFNVITGSGVVTNSSTTAATLGLSRGGANTLATTAVIEDGAGGADKVIVRPQNSAILSGANTYTGATIIDGGTLSAGVASVAGVSGAFGNNSAVNLLGGGLNLTNGLFSYNTQIGSLTGTFGIALGTATLTIGGDNTSPAAYSGAITDTSGGAINKIGTGTLTFSGASTYSGGTVVSGGTFLVNNASGSGTGSGSVTLNGGTLGGTGIITGTITAGTAAHTIAPSATLSATTASTLTVGGLKTNTQTTLSFNLVTRNTTGGSDLINVTGANGLSITGGTLNIANSPVGLTSLGYYKAIGYNGAIQGTGYTSVLLPAASAGNIVYTLDVAHDANFIDIHRGFEGDANDDGSVTFADFVALSNHFGLADAGWGGGDFNGDGTTNFADFVVLSNHFGLTVGGGSLVASADDFAEFAAGAQALFGGAAPVPEPASLGLLALGLGGVLLRRRRRA